MAPAQNESTSTNGRRGNPSVVMAVSRLLVVWLVRLGRLRGSKDPSQLTTRRWMRGFSRDQQVRAVGYARTPSIDNQRYRCLEELVVST